MKTLKPGHRAIFTFDGEWVTVLKVRDESTAIKVGYDNGRTCWCLREELQPETFVEFISREDGFGETPWAHFVGYQFFAAVIAVGGFTITSTGAIGLSVAILMEAFLMIATIADYQAPSTPEDQ